MRACGREPCSAKPSGKLKSKHIKAPPPGGFLFARAQSASRFSGASRGRSSAKIFEPRITLQNVMLPLPLHGADARFTSVTGCKTELLWPARYFPLWAPEEPAAGGRCTARGAAAQFRIPLYEVRPGRSDRG